MDKFKSLAQGRADNQIDLAEKMKKDLSTLRTENRIIYTEIVEKIEINQNDGHLSGENANETVKMHSIKHSLKDNP